MLLCLLLVTRWERTERIVSEAAQVAMHALLWLYLPYSMPHSFPLPPPPLTKDGVLTTHAESA